MPRRIVLRYETRPMEAAERIRMGDEVYVDLDGRLWATPYRGDDLAKARAKAPTVADSDAAPGEMVRLRETYTTGPIG
jgi:predicted transcriptional regulator